MFSISDFRKKYNKKIAPLDLDLILAHSLDKTREFILTYPDLPINEEQEKKINESIKRRLRCEPIAYITGHKEFYGLDFIVTKDTLIPRPETEMLVELALDELKTKNYQPKTILDIGTGSGNIIISIARVLDSRLRENDVFSFFAIDISRRALNVAKLNAKRHKVFNKIKFIHSNLLNEFLKAKKLTKLRPEKLIIIANLPYLDIGWKNLLKSRETKGLKFEPRIALYAGKDGLDAYRKFAEQLKLLSEQMKNDITVFCEIGHLQLRDMRRIFSFAKNVEFFKDLAGRWRVCKIDIQCRPERTKRVEGSV